MAPGFKPFMTELKTPDGLVLFLSGGKAEELSNQGRI